MPPPVPPPPRAPTGAPPAAPRPPAPAAPVAAAPSAPPAPRPPVAPPAPVSAPAAPVAPVAAAPAPVVAAPPAPVAPAPALTALEIVAPIPVSAPVSTAPAVIQTPVTLTAPVTVQRKAKESYGAKDLTVPTFGGQDVLALGAQLEAWLKDYLAAFKADGEVTTKVKFPDTAIGHRAYGLSRCFALIAQTLLKDVRAPKGKDPVVEKMRARTLAIIKSFGYARFMEEFAQDGADTIQMLNLTDVEKIALGIPA